jgi:hypothetical protein
MHTDRCSNGNGQECNATEEEKVLKMQEFTFRDTSSVGHELSDCTGSNCTIVPVVTVRLYR